MILGIGTDLMDINRIAKTLERHGERFLDRCFAPEERARVEGGGLAHRAAGYAKRWAAKEACAKALGFGVNDTVFLKDMVVVNDLAGKPSMILKAGAKDRLTALTPRGMNPYIQISLTDEPPMALAFVVISAMPATGENR